MQYFHYVGVDISKETLDVALYPSRDSKSNYLQISNNPKGLREMMLWLKGKQVEFKTLLICAEHTGLYTNNLITFADKHSISLWLASPLAIKRSLGLARGKSDQLDASRIAEYAYTFREKIRLYQKPSKTITQLQLLLSERKQYVKQRSALLAIRSEVKHHQTSEGRARLESSIHHLEKMVHAVEKQMKCLVHEDREVRRNYELVSSVKGIGLINAINTIVFTNNFKSFHTPRQYACYIGVAPFEHTSGTSVRGKTGVSRLCRTRQKAELSMAARSAIRNDPGIRKYYQRKMAEKGGARSAHGIVLNAVKFKLILRMFAVVKAGTPYKVLNY